jgi:Protein of unknown function (DUF2924)
MHIRQPIIPTLSELSTVGRAELLAIWTATFDQPPTALRSSRELLASALAWQLQERKFGGLSGATRRKLRVLARAHQRKTRSPQSLGASANLRPGTVIRKQWRGAEHVVMVLAEGFQHQNKVYGSLSQLAREITGTRWNGPAFFGLRKGHGRQAKVRHAGQ